MAEKRVSPSSTGSSTAWYLRSFVAPELLNDMLLQVARTGRGENGRWRTVRRCPQHVVQLTFDLCHMLGAGHHEKYAAIELFEDFCERHVKLVRKDLDREKCSPDTRRQTRCNLQKQVLLRLVSCIIIAHKYHRPTEKGHCQLKEFLAKCLSVVRVVAPKCTQEILIRSEFRVLQVRHPLPLITMTAMAIMMMSSMFCCPSPVRLEVINASFRCLVEMLMRQTVDFRVQKPMPLPYLQIMSEVVHHNRPPLFSWQWSSLVCMICDCYYLHREHLHRKIRSLDACDSLRDQILLLSAAILATTAFVCMDTGRRDAMGEELAFLTSIPKKQICDLRDSFLLVICERRTNNPSVRNHNNK